MTRAVSTVVDVSLAMLLVSAAVLALVAIPDDEPAPPDPDAAARTVLASTLTATFGPDDGRVAAGRVSTLLAHAAVADAASGRGFVDSVLAAVDAVLADAGGRIEVVATAGGDPLRVGPRPPPDAAVAATTHEVPANETTVTVTVRTWSP